MLIYYYYHIIRCMRTLIDFAIREEYSRVKALGDDLSDINSLINWDRFRFLEPLIYKNKTSRGGRPNIDIVIMVKALVLQSWFGLSDPELERQVTDRNLVSNFPWHHWSDPRFQHCLAISGAVDRMRQIRGYLERASDAAWWERVYRKEGHNSGCYLHNIWSWSKEE